VSVGNQDGPQVRSEKGIQAWIVNHHARLLFRGLFANYPWCIADNVLDTPRQRPEAASYIESAEYNCVYPYLIGKRCNLPGTEDPFYFAEDRANDLCVNLATLELGLPSAFRHLIVLERQ